MATVQGLVETKVYVSVISDGSLISHGHGVLYQQSNGTLTIDDEVATFHKQPGEMKWSCIDIEQDVDSEGYSLEKKYDVFTFGTDIGLETLIGQGMIDEWFNQDILSIDKPQPLLKLFSDDWKDEKKLLEDQLKAFDIDENLSVEDLSDKDQIRIDLEEHTKIVELILMLEEYQKDGAKKE